ncbi:MBL fold metallo-hydrolase [Chitinophagales bacterium]|nr:MBL fold metallo-hydrolase [Chitinophagales bacterium]
MKIGFYGAAQQVTGSKHLITLESGKTILLDCGLFQGKGSEVADYNRHFGFNPERIDIVILSHAHIDHTGLLPKLVREGYKGKVYCTSATADLCSILLPDSAHIQESDIKYINRALKARGKDPIQPLYSIRDAEAALKLFHPIPYEKKFKIDDEVEVTFTDVGHILGSAAINLRLKDGNQYKRVAFTGDIGRYNNRILKKPQPFPQCDYLITESTYGNKLHDRPAKAKERLLEVVKRACVEKKGKLIIPAFSVGRTQEIVSVLNDLEFEGKLPKLPVYVDSPLAVNATDIIKAHPECYNERMLKFMSKDSDPFGFNGLNYVRKVEESKAINDKKGPMIIISSSGMIEGGRIKHHLINNIEDPKNTILIVGYCSKSSLGGRLRDGLEEARIFGKSYKVKAEVEVLNPFSAHGDFEEMIKYLNCQEKHIIKKTFLVHGDPEVMEEYKEKLTRAGFHNIEMPYFKAEYEV